MKSIEQKRKEATQRAAARAKRSTKEQLLLCASRRGDSKREVNRLAKAAS